MKKVLVSAVLFTALAAPLAAQEEERKPGPPMPCPHPVIVTIKAETHPPTPDPADFGPKLAPLVAGSQWNQTAIDKAFGTTFHFPGEAKCCAWTKGTLVVTVKALQSGKPGSSTSANDDIDIISGGSPVPGLGRRIWPSGATAGSSTTIPINIPANILDKGEFSLYVEDDTAVLSAHLTLEGCCLRK